MNDTILQCQSCGVKNRIPVNKMHMKPKCGRCGHMLEPGVGGNVVELDDSSFDKTVGSSSLPVMVDFYSPSCGPCHMLAPVIEKLAQQYAGKIIIAKYDTSRYQMAASRFQIKGVPTLIFFKQGKVVDQIVGAAPQVDIERQLNNLI